MLPKFEILSFISCKLKKFDSKYRLTLSSDPKLDYPMCCTVWLAVQTQDLDSLRISAHQISRIA